MAYVANKQFYIITRTENKSVEPEISVWTLIYLVTGNSIQIRHKY